MVRLPAVALLIASVALGQTPDTKGPPEQPRDELGRDTPYGTVTGFLEAATTGDDAKAARYLNIYNKNAPELADQLQVVMDRGLSGDLDHVSHDPQGDVQDGLPGNQERIGIVETASGKLNIDLDRITQRDGPDLWLFSRRTLADVPRIATVLDVPEGFAKFVPAPIRETRLLGIPLWRWVAVAGGMGLALLIASLVARLLVPLLEALLWRWTGEHDHVRSSDLRNPVRVILFAIMTQFVSSMSSSLVMRQTWNNIAVAIGVIGFALLLMAFIEITSHLYSRRLVHQQRPSRLAIVAFTRRLLKILVGLIAGLELLHRAGVNITALMAGLGVGGVALALAAQRTLENVFGGISVIMQDNIHVGDFCRVGDLTGTVEDIGLGTTRLRTLDRTIVAVPNAHLAQANLENFSMRDKNWFHQEFGLRHDTTPDQTREILKAITQLLQNHPRVDASNARIRFIGIGTSSLTLEIFAYILEADFTASLAIRQELLLGTLEIIGASGASVAVPMVLEKPEDQHQTAVESATPASKG